MKRLCIYVTYDYENIVDDDIGYMLKELRCMSDRVVVVCNYGHISCGIEMYSPMQMSYCTGKTEAMTAVPIRRFWGRSQIWKVMMS